jgi:hypothetical protein
MKNMLLVTFAVLALAVSACAPAEPTVDPAQIQASAVAAASTMVALTEQAIPTPTQEPPTPLPSPSPLPSPTLVELPTLPVLGQPTTAPVPTTSGDPCQGPMSPDVEGPTATVKISNSTNGDVVLSLYLHKNLFGECGYRGFNISPHGSLSVTGLPQGCYFGGAFVNDAKKQTKSFGNGCINSEKGTVVVGPDIISINTN